MRKNLLLLFCILPIVSFGQVYSFNRQLIMRFTDTKRHSEDIWLIPIEIEVQSKFIIMSRPPNGAGEKRLVDSLKIVNKSKVKNKDVVKFTVKDGRTVVIYSDQLITMCTKEKKNGSRTEYCFYNQKD